MDNWIAVADLLALLEDVGLDGPGVRAAVARLKKKKLLEPENRNNIAGYRATQELQTVLAEGESTIFATDPPASLDDGWLLAIFSVPESERERRRQLRNNLTSLGFGPIASGVFMAPRHVEANARRLLSRNDLSSYVHLFQSQHVGFGVLEDLTKSAWNDADLGESYRGFTEANHGVVETVKLSRTPDRDAFVACMHALEDWRPLPYLDPGLPDEVQSFAPERSIAQALFAEIGAELKDISNRHVRSTLRQFDH